MPTTLISLIGKSRLDPQTGYPTARYRYPDGQVRETPFFGMGLKDCIQPDRLVIAGTRGSMWDVFFDHQNAGDDILPLIDAVAAANVTPDLLTAPAQQLSQRFGIPVQCLLIPYAENEMQQAQILLALADAVQPGDNIVLDITHGFRHLPMLALVAARYLKYVRRVKVQGVYYGARELSHGDEAPVLNLNGMLQMLDWVESLAIYERSGDYGVFASLFEADGMAPDRAAMLAEAAYFERSNRPALAAPKISSAFNHIREHTGSLGQLFSEPLSKNISWFKSERSEWELALADRYLERGDYMRAIIFMHEAAITREVWMQRGDPNNYAEREEMTKSLRSKYEFRQLKDLRNSMAHGTRAESEDDNWRKRKDNEYIDRLLADETKLAQKLRELRKTLF